MAAALLGAEVIKNDGTKVQVSSFCSDGKIVGKDMNKINDGKIWIG